MLRGGVHKSLYPSQASRFVPINHSIAHVLDYRFHSQYAFIGPPAVRDLSRRPLPKSCPWVYLQQYSYKHLCAIGWIVHASVRRHFTPCDLYVIYPLLSVFLFPLFDFAHGRSYSQLDFLLLTNPRIPVYTFVVPYRPLHGLSGATPRNTKSRGRRS